MGFEPFKRWMRPLRLQRRLARFLPTPSFPRLRLEFSPAGRPWHDVVLRRERNNLRVTLASRSELQADHVYFCYRTNLPVAVHLVSRASPTVGRIAFDPNDGSPVACTRMLFSGSAADAHLIPDPDFFHTHGYASIRPLIAGQRPWRERSNAVVWRGATTGRGRFPLSPEELSNPEVLQRVRMCARLARTPCADVKLYSVVQSKDPGRDTALLAACGLLGTRLDQTSWLDRKFAIDIDGNANAWSNLFIRMLFGCCVLKVQSSWNFRQWYYDRLQPFVHYVPVAADLGDLGQCIDWCRSHLDESRRIGAAAQALALEMTFEREMDGAVAEIERRFAGSR